MAWNTGVTNNDRTIFTETITLGNATQADSSTIDFIPPGKDFVVFINTGATNTVGAVVTDLEGSIDDSNWADVDASFASDLDTLMIIKSYDTSASGDHPYYRLEFDCTANDSATTIDVSVVIGA